MKLCPCGCASRTCGSWHWPSGYCCTPQLVVAIEPQAVHHIDLVSSHGGPHTNTHCNATNTHTHCTWSSSSSKNNELELFPLNEPLSLLGPEPLRAPAAEVVTDERRPAFVDALSVPERLPTERPAAAAEPLLAPVERTCPLPVLLRFAVLVWLLVCLLLLLLLVLLALELVSGDGAACLAPPPAAVGSWEFCLSTSSFCDVQVCVSVCVSVRH